MRRPPVVEVRQYSKHDPEALTEAERVQLWQYYQQLTDDGVIVIRPQRRSLYLRLVQWIVIGLLGLLLLVGFLALFGRVTGGITSAPTTVATGSPPRVTVTLGTVFAHPPTTVAVGPTSTFAASTGIGGGDIATGSLLVLLVVLGVVGAVAYWFYLHLIMTSHYITITRRQIHINNSLLRRDPQTLPIDRFSDGRYDQPFLSVALSRGNKNLAWSWGNKFEIDTPGAQRNVRIDNVPQPRVVMSLINELFRDYSARSSQAMKRQIGLAQAQYALAMGDHDFEPDPDLMKPWPPPPTMPAWAPEPPERAP